ncbi:MAG: hypothetical protein AB8C46_20045 [Burkholderiaceae bacterium]
MKSGTTLAVLFVIGYVGFEAYAVHKVSYRTEPTYLHNMLIQAKTVVQSCAADTNRDVEGFERSLARVTQKFKLEIAEQSPSRDSSEIDQVIASKAAASQSAAEDEVARLGCKHIEIRNHMKRFDIYASKG